MATEIRSFGCTVPANTPASAPVAFDTSFPPRIVQGIEIIVPPGPSGLVGFAVQNSGVTVIPYDSDPWIITAAEKIAWPLEAQIDSGAWSLLAYNTGANDHTVYVRYLLAPVTKTVDVHPVLIPEADLIAPDTVMATSEGTVTAG